MLFINFFKEFKMSFQHDILAATQAFNENLHKLAQQEVSKLMDTVRQENMTTKSEFFDRVGGIRMLPRTSRHQDTAFTPLPFSRRRVDILDYEVGDIIDENEDVKKSLVNPRSATLMRFAEAGKINIDKTIIDGLLGSATAADSEFTISSIALPDTQKVLDAGSNMSVDKIKTALEKLGTADVDLAIDRPIMAIAYNQYKALLNDNEFINRDFKLTSGEKLGPAMVSEILGVDIRIVAQEVLPKVGNIRSTVLYTKNAGILGLNNMFSAKVLEDPTKGGSLRVIGKQNIGAVRMEEERTVQIDCDETA
jgi:hypothetical protein